MSTDGTFTFSAYRKADGANWNKSVETADSDSTVFAGEKSDGNSVHFDSISNPPTPTTSSSAIKSNTRSQTEHLTDAVEHGRALFGSPISFYDSNKHRSHFEALRNAGRHDSEIHDMSGASLLDLSTHYVESTPQQRPLAFRAGERSAPPHNLSPKLPSRIPVRTSLQPLSENAPAARGLAQNAALVVDALRSAQAATTDSPTWAIAEKLRHLRINSNSNLVESKGSTRQRDKAMEMETPVGTRTVPRNDIMLNANLNTSANMSATMRAQSMSQTISNSSANISSSFDLVSSQNSENAEPALRADRPAENLSMSHTSRRGASLRAQGDSSLPPLPAGSMNTSGKKNESGNASIDLLRYMTQQQREPAADESSAFRLSDVLASPSNDEAAHSRSELQSAMRSYRVEYDQPYPYTERNQLLEHASDEEDDESPPIRLTNEEVAALMDAELDEDVEETGLNEQDVAEQRSQHVIMLQPKSASASARADAVVASNATPQTQNAAPFSFRGMSLSTESLLRELEAEEQSVSRQIDAVGTNANGNLSKAEPSPTVASISINTPVLNRPSSLTANATTASMKTRLQTAGPRQSNQYEPHNAASPVASGSDETTKVKVDAAANSIPTPTSTRAATNNQSIGEYFRHRSAPLGKLLHDATPTFGLSHSAVLTPSRSVIGQESQLTTSLQVDASVNHATFVCQPASASMSNRHDPEAIAANAADDTQSSSTGPSSINSKLNVTDDNNNETLQSGTISSFADTDAEADEPDDDAVSLNTNRLVRRLLTESKLSELLAINARDANSTLIESDIIDYLARISSLQSGGTTATPVQAKANDSRVDASSAVSPKRDTTLTPNKPPIAPSGLSAASANRSKSDRLGASPNMRTRTPLLADGADQERPSVTTSISSQKMTATDSRPSMRSSTPSCVPTGEHELRQRRASSSSASERTATSSTSNMLTTITPASSSGTIDTMKHTATSTKPDSAFHEAPTTASSCVDNHAAAHSGASRGCISFAKRLLFPRTRVGALASQSWLVRNDSFDWLCVSLKRLAADDFSGSQDGVFLLEPSFVVEPHSSKSQRVVFAPRADGVITWEYDVSVRVLDDAQSTTVTHERLMLTGTAECVRVQLSLGQPDANESKESLTVDFGSLHWNVKTSRTVTLSNLGALATPLSLRIVRDAGDCSVDDDTFTFGNETTMKRCVLDPFARTTVRIRCSAPGTRSELLACRARLLVAVEPAPTEGSTEPPTDGLAIATVPLCATFGTAKLHVEGALDSLRFDAQSRDETQVRSFRLFNVGTIPVTVALCVLEDGRSLFDVSPRVLRLPFDSSELVHVTLHRNDLGTSRRTSDNEHPLYQARVLLSVEPDGPQCSVGLRVLEKSASGSLKSEARTERTVEPRAARVSDPTKKGDVSPAHRPIETGCLLSSRQVVEFGGVQLGAVTRERIVLKNAHTTRTLHLTLKLDCLPEANFALEVESHGQTGGAKSNVSASSQSGAHGRTGASGSLNLVLEPQQLRSVYISFAPTRCIAVSGKLAIRAAEFRQKYSIPLSAYGGVSWLTASDGGAHGQPAADGDRPESINALTLVRDADRADSWRGSLVLSNSGWRAAFVRLLPTIKSDALSTNVTMLAAEVERETVVRVSPCSQFVLLSNQSRSLQIEVQLIGDLSKRLRGVRNEPPAGRQATVLLGKLLLLSGDEILRQRVRRSMRTRSSKTLASPKRNQVAVVLSQQYPLNEFDVTCDGELLCNEQALNEGEQDAAIFYERLRLIELSVYLNLAPARSSLSVSVSQSRTVNASNSHDATPNATPKAVSSANGTLLANRQTPMKPTLVSVSPGRPSMGANSVTRLPDVQRSHIQPSLSGRSTSSYVSHSDSATVHIDCSDSERVLSTSNSNLTGFTNYTDLTSVSEAPAAGADETEHRQLEHKLSLDRKILDFGKAKTNEKKEALFKFCNKSLEPVCMRIWLSDPVRFALAGTKVRVQPKHYVLPRVSFCSSTPGAFHALLMLTNADRPQEYLTLRLQAECE